MTRKRDSFGEINLPSSQPMLLRIGPLYGEDSESAEKTHIQTTHRTLFLTHVEVTEAALLPLAAPVRRDASSATHEICVI